MSWAVAGLDKGSQGFVNVDALITRIGCWGMLYYNYNKEHPKIVLIVI